MVSSKSAWWQLCAEKEGLPPKSMGGGCDNTRTIAPEVFGCHLLQPCGLFSGEVASKLIVNSNL